MTAALCTVLLAAGCAVEKPQVPRSAIVLRVPVANDTTALSEIVEDSDYLVVRGDDSIALQYNREFSDLQGRIQVGDRLAVTPRPARFATPVGEISIPGRVDTLLPVAAGELLPDEFLGQEVRLPEDASLSGIEVEVPLPGVESLAVASGSLTLEIANGLPVTLVELEFALVDQGEGGRTVQTAGIGRIDAGGTGSAVFELAGRGISGDLALLLRGARLEAESETVTLRSDDALGITLRLSRLGVREATAVLEPQVIAPVEPAVLEFPDDRIQLKRAVIESGSITLVVTNELPVTMDVTLQLPELVDAEAGEPPTWVIDELETGIPREVVFHLDGHVLRPEDPLQLRIGYAGRTHPAGEAVTLRSDAALLVEAVAGRLTFREIRGRLNRLPLGRIDPQTRQVDLPAGADTINAVTFDSAGMNVTYTSAVGVPASVALRIVGTDSAIPDSAGIERTMRLEVETEAGFPANPVTRTIDVAPDRLAGFLDFLPRRVTVNVDSVLIGRVGGAEDTALVRSDHWVRLDNVAFVAPARLRADTSYFESNPRSQGAFTDAEARRRINANIAGALVTTTVLNKTPLAIGVRLFTAYDPGLVFSDPILTLPKEEGEYFSVDPDAPAIRQVSLSADDLRLLLDIDPDDPGPAAGGQVRTLYSGVKIRLAAPSLDQIYGDDIVVVQAQAEIFIELNESLLE